MKIETTTQFYLIADDAMDASRKGLKYNVVRDVSQVHFGTGAPNMVNSHDETKCDNLAHGLTEWWAQINRHLRAHEECKIIDISPDYCVTLFHTHEG